MCGRAKINLKASNMALKVIGHFCCRSLYLRTPNPNWRSIVLEKAANTCKEHVTDGTWHNKTTWKCLGNLPRVVGLGNLHILALGFFDETFP